MKNIEILLLSTEAMHDAIREASLLALEGISGRSRSVRLKVKQRRATMRRGSPEIVAKLRARVSGPRSLITPEGQR